MSCYKHWFSIWKSTLSKPITTQPRMILMSSGPTVHFTSNLPGLPCMMLVPMSRFASSSTSGIRTCFRCGQCSRSIVRGIFSWWTGIFLRVKIAGKFQKMLDSIPDTSKLDIKKLSRTPSFWEGSPSFFPVRWSPFMSRLLQNEAVLPGTTRKLPKFCTPFGLHVAGL